MRSYFLHGCSLLCLLALLPVVAHATDALQPRAEVGVKAGSERSVLTTEFWAPLAQKSDRVVYADVRLMGDNDENREGNLGFGYRQLSEKTNSVIGVHGWIDRRRTEYNNTFHAVTLGVESLGSVIDLRANGYIALGGSETAITPNLGPTTPYLAGTGLFYNTNGSVTETPQHGVDAEAGYRLPIFEKHVDTLRVFGGGYHFFRSNTDNVTGVRIRTEAQINPALSVGARFQHDGPRGSQGFLEATLKFPFSAKKMFQKSGLRARLDESPERDIDIVTGAKVDNGQRQITNSTTGDAQRILYVDNSNTQSGDGSYENPFSTLKAAEAALKANDILYVKAGNGTTTGMDQGINITQSGVSLIGSGSALTVSGITFLNAGAAPTITNTQTSTDNFTGNGVTVTEANSTIAGITVSTVTGSGIEVYTNSAGKNLGNISIYDVTVIGNKRGINAGIYNGSFIDNLVINNVTSSNNATWGILFSAKTGGQAGSIIVKNSNSFNNTQHGIVITSDNSNSKIENVFIDKNTASGNAQQNFFVRSSASGQISNVSMTGNNGINSSVENFWVTANGGLIDKVNVENNNSFGSASAVIGYGIHIQAINTGSQINEAVIRNNTSSNNKVSGIIIDAGTGGAIQKTELSNNTTNNNNLYGIYLYANGANAVLNNISMSYNNIISNNNFGVYGLQTDATGILNVNLGDSASNPGYNRIFNSGNRDIRFSYVNAGHALSAQNNWWGTASGLQASRYTLTNATIDSSGFLTTDPRP